MPEETVTLVLLPSEADPPLRSRQYQGELQAFMDSLEAQGLEVSSMGEVQESAESGFVLLGEFLVKNGATVLVGLATPLGTLLGVWLQAKYGRKVRFKDGDFEAEAATVEQLEQVVQLAQRYRNSQPRIQP